MTEREVEKLGDERNGGGEAGRRGKGRRRSCETRERQVEELGDGMLGRGPPGQPKCPAAFSRAALMTSDYRPLGDEDARMHNTV